MRPVELMPFSFEEYLSRFDWCRTVLEEDDVDMMLISAPDDIFWLTGFDSIGFYAFQVLAVPREGEPAIFLQAVEHSLTRHRCIVEDARTWAHGDDNLGMAAGIVREFKLGSRRVGYQGDSY